MKKAVWCIQQWYKGNLVDNVFCGILYFDNEKAHDQADVLNGKLDSTFKVVLIATEIIE